MADAPPIPDDGNRPPEGDREDDDLKLLRQATARLMEHFDTIQIFATRHIDSDVGTVGATHGDGNYYARRGQIGEWITKQDQGARNEVD